MHAPPGAEKEHLSLELPDAERLNGTGNGDAVQAFRVQVRASTSLQVGTGGNLGTEHQTIHNARILMPRN